MMFGRGCDITCLSIRDDAPVKCIYLLQPFYRLIIISINPTNPAASTLYVAVAFISYYLPGFDSTAPSVRIEAPAVVGEG